MCIIESCNNKIKYGNYCFKHRSNHLIDNNTKLIRLDTFTNKQSDYLKKDIINTIKKLSKTNLNISSLKKEELYNILFTEITKLSKYDQKDINKIILLQKTYRKKQNDKYLILRGEGYQNRKLCNNETDFFTYETYDEINDKYFFSYKDDQNIIWFFDIRSFNKLIEMNQPNPYTMKEIPSKIIEKSKILTELLKLDKRDELIDKTALKLSRKEIIKQKCIDFFSEISQCGWDCQPEWFLNLNTFLLKKLYRNLEDLWNYRLQLTNEMKLRICPPNGIIFNIPVSQVNNINSSTTLKEIIINESIKFNNATNIEDRKLGYIYFLIGLGIVSRECYESHISLMASLSPT